MVTFDQVQSMLDDYAQMFMGSGMHTSNAPIAESRPSMRSCMRAAELEASIIATVRLQDTDTKLFYLLYCTRQWATTEISEATDWPVIKAERIYDQLVNVLYDSLNNNRMRHIKPKGRGWVGRMPGQTGPEIPVREW